MQNGILGLLSGAVTGVSSPSKSKKRRRFLNPRPKYVIGTRKHGCNVNEYGRKIRRRYLSKMEREKRRRIQKAKGKK